MRNLIVDGDILTFRAAFSAEAEAEAWVACSRASKILEDMVMETEVEKYEVWISGKNNFRYQVYPEYKANRIGMKRPKWEQEVKSYLVHTYNAKVSDGCEADDMMGVRSMQEGKDLGIIATIDKDLNMIPGWHYNFVKKELFHVTPEEADRFFFYQLIVGDTTDNIKGVPGLGPKKAEKLLSGYSTPQEWYSVIRELYSCEEELDMNAQCLYIWRKMNDNWRSLIENKV